MTVPDLPRCTTAGDDLDEALRNAKEATTSHLEAMIAAGEHVPAPTTDRYGLPNPPGCPAADRLCHDIALDAQRPENVQTGGNCNVLLRRSPSAGERYR